MLCGHGRFCIFIQADQPAPKKLRKLKPVGSGIVNIYIEARITPIITIIITAALFGRLLNTPTIPSRKRTTE